MRFIIMLLIFPLCCVSKEQRTEDEMDLKCAWPADCRRIREENEK